MPAKLNLQLREGATFRRRLRWTDDRQVPVNLTGVAVVAQFRDRPDGELLLELTQANGRITVTPLLGIIDLFISAEDTAAMAYARAAWDLKAIWPGPGGDVLYPIEGSVIVARSVTI